jgi:hypothetical protein
MSRELRVYKPNRAGNGAALKIQYRNKKKQGKEFVEPMLFLEIAKQLGVDSNDNAKFDWAGNAETHTGFSVTMKLGCVDVGEILCVLLGQKTQVGPPPKGSQRASSGLFHKNKNGSTVLKFASLTDNTGYAMQLSTSKEHSFRLMLTQGEGIQLRVMLEEFLRKFYDWNE